jgi:hypothetical protein
MIILNPDTTSTIYPTEFIAGTALGTAIMSHMILPYNVSEVGVNPPLLAST